MHDRRTVHAEELKSSIETTDVFACEILARSVDVAFVYTAGLLSGET